MPTPPALKMLRLRKAGRYVVALLESDGNLKSTSYWSETQALIASGVLPAQWSSVPTEVFTEIHSDTIPADVSLFARSTRKGRLHGVVLWTKDGLFPTVLNTIEEALAIVDQREADGREHIPLAKAA